MKKVLKYLAISALIWFFSGRSYQFICWFLEGCADNLSDIADFIKFELLEYSLDEIAIWIDSISYLWEEAGWVAVFAYFVFLIFPKRRSSF